MRAVRFLHITTYVTSQLQMGNGYPWEHKGSELHHRSDFLHGYYTFESLHDSNHNSVVRISWGFLVSLEASLIALHYIISCDG